MRFFVVVAALTSTFLLITCHVRSINGEPMDIDDPKDMMEVDEPLVSANTNAGSKNVPKIFDYGEYVEQFRKNYSPIETLNKAKIFFGRTMNIFKHNVLFKERKINYYLGQNQFTDMTAKELKKYHSLPDSDLRPVQEASMNPDLPASSSVIASKFKNKNGEGESQASLYDLNAKLVPKTRPVVNFMNDDEVKIDDIKGMLKRLEKRPDLAEQIAQVVDAENNNQELKRIKEEHRSIEELAARENRIQLKPMPKSNNKNYDVESIVSFGASRDVYDDFANNYAKFLMNDPNDFGGLNLQPYENLSGGEDDDDDENEVLDQVIEAESPLTRLFGSMKSIYDFFTLDDYDESQDQDVAPTNVEKPVANGGDQSNNKQPSGSAATLSVINYDIDWRKTGCITKAMDQKDCNACYAFSTISLMEYFHCMQTKQLTEFSSQYIVDCGPRTELHGCQGGKITGVGQFIRKYGVELATTYPYNARENQCSIVSDDKAGYLKPTISAWQSFPSIGAWYKWLAKSPIIVGISMPGDFFGYSGEIHDGANCDEKMVHAMLLVGSGTQNGKEFWLLKNSFSDNWGEAGYFRLSKAAPMRCFNTAVVVRPKFA